MYLKRKFCLYDRRKQVMSVRDNSKASTHITYPLRYKAHQFLYVDVSFKYRHTQREGRA